MKNNLFISLCSVCLVLTVSNAQTQRFQADKFLDMLANTFDATTAYMDLLDALQKRMNLDPLSKIGASNNGSTGGVAMDAGVGNPNTLAERSPNCPPAPAVLGATVSYTSNTYTLGSRAYYQCDKGYQGTSQFIQCLTGGRWSPLNAAAVCQAVDCGAPPPSVANADPTYTTTTYMSVVTYKCRPGHQQAPANANATCQENGQWTTPTFTCPQIQVSPINGFNVASFMNAMGGANGGGSPSPMITAMMKSMPGLSGMQQPGETSNPTANTNTNTNPMLSMMFPGLGPASPSTPQVQAPSFPGMPAMGGFQLPSHLQGLLPNGISSTQGMKPKDLLALTAAGMGSANPATAPRDINSLLQSMNPMSMMGPGVFGMQAGRPGAGGRPPMDPEMMAEQREEMMKRAAMATMMKSFMGGHANNNNNNNNGTVQQKNPAMDMMTMLALQNSMGAGGSGGGGMESGFPGMMLGGGLGGLGALLSGGGGGGANIFSGLFGA